jgi:ABC-type polysaccharide/polyol phosphate export permease
MTKVADYVASRELMAHLTLRELRSKYKRSLLGWTWSLLNPLASMLIFTLVFRFFLRIQAPPSEGADLQNFALYLTCALLPWNFLTNGVSGSIGTLVGNANLIKKTYFPRDLLVGAQVASWVVSLLLEMLILTVAFLLFGNMVLVWIPVVLLLIVLLTMFVTGFSLIFSVLNVYFRDVQHFVGIIFQIWFYMTPVVYPIGLVPIKANIFGALVPVRQIYDLNPMVQFVEAFRSCLYDLRAPELSTFAYLVGVSVGTLAFGLFLFGKLEGKLAEEL